MAAERAEATPASAREAGDLRVCGSRLARRLRQEDRGHALTTSQLTALSRLGERAAGERVRLRSMARTLGTLEEEEEHPPASDRVSATGTDSSGPAGSGGVWMSV